jgi:HD-like signal output (HDOD) protein
VTVTGLGVAEPSRGVADDEPAATFHGRGMAVDPSQLRAHRAFAGGDVLACGVLLQHLLSGNAPFGLGDTRAVIAQLAPNGTQVLHLPWTTPLPVPEPLRAIADRATSPQVSLRFRSARTFVGALSGWLQIRIDDAGGPVALLLERTRIAGHLPARAGLSTRIGRIVALEGRRSDAIASEILPDLALTLELLRTMNTAAAQGTRLPGDGTVLALRRVIALIGVNGIRNAAQGLRRWPGTLNQEDGARLRRTCDEVRLAGHLAQALRPAGYDPEVVYVVTVLQNLGRLLVRCHFPTESLQMDRLLHAQTGADERTAPRPMLGRAAAARAVFGVELADFGTALARQWGFQDDVLQMLRPVPAEQAAR